MKRTERTISEKSEVRSWNDFETTKTMRPINFEILPVDSKHAPQTLTFRDAHQGGISEIHRQVAILPHQLTHAGAIVQTEVREPHTNDVDHVPQGALGVCAYPQQVHRFSNCGPDRA